jgi:hypothetical protein
MKAAVLVGTMLAMAACNLPRQTTTTANGPGVYTVRTEGVGLVDQGGAENEAYVQAAGMCPWGYDVLGQRDNLNHYGDHVRPETELVIACRPAPAPAAPAVPWGSGFYCTRHATAHSPDVCTRSYQDCLTYRGTQPLSPCTWTSTARCFLIYPHKVERCSVAPAACDQYRSNESARGSSTSICIDAR